MKNIILFGPPGSGKGTQSKKIAEKYNLIHISTGDIIREEIKQGTELGKKVGSLGSGELVSDEIVIELIEEKIKRSYATIPNKDLHGFIFDGFPRTIEQAIELSKMIDIDKAILLMVNDNEVVRRILQRGEKSGRADDNKPAAMIRLNEYTNKTYPIKQMYSLEGKLSVLNGEASIDDVFNSICKIIDSN